MKILIDFQGAQGFGSGRGIGAYTFEFSRGLVALDDSRFEVFLLLNMSIEDGLAELIREVRFFCDRDKILGFFVPKSSDVKNIGWRSQALINRRSVINQLDPDIVVLTSLFEPPSSPVVSVVDPLVGSAHVSVLYDLIPKEMPSKYLTTVNAKESYENSIAQLLKSNLVLTISEYTASVFHKIYRNQHRPRTVVVGTATMKRLSAFAGKKRSELIEKKALPLELVNKLRINENFILTVSGQDERKNLRLLIAAFLNLSSNYRKYQLVVVCHLEDNIKNKLLDEISGDASLKAEIIFTGYLESDELDILYRLCKLFIFPSLQEGFGLPVLEAMTFGSPCLVANTSSLPEVAGKACIFFDPLNQKDLEEKLTRLLSDESLLLKLSQYSIERSKEFSWEKVVKKTTKAIAEIKRAKDIQGSSSVDAVKQTSVHEKKKLAYISPLPPLKSGISKYSMTLIKFLKRFYNITVVNELGVNSNTFELPSGVASICSLDFFEENYFSFDRVLYHFGNSRFHSHYFDLVELYPGVVVLHDFYLDGVVSLKDDFQEILFESYGVAANCSVFLQDFPKINYPCNLNTIDSSIGIILHSNFAMGLASRWYGDKVTRRCAVVPLLKDFKENKKKSNVVGRVSKGEKYICSFGYLGPNKMNKDLFKAWSDSVSLESTLVFVGAEGDEDYCKELRNLISDFGLESRVIFTGWVDEKTYNLWLLKATVAVQLRINSRGETSASLFDCFANEVPAIVNEHGDNASLPDSVVCKIPENFSSHHLAKSLKAMIDDSPMRRRFIKNAHSFLSEYHSPELCAEKYFLAIENFYNQSKKNLFPSLVYLRKEGFLPEGNSETEKFLDSLLKTNLFTSRVKTLYVDISEIVKGDIRTGIQRVVRNILRALISNNVEVAKYRIEPVCIAEKDQHYLSAGTFLTKFFGLPVELPNRYIEPQRGDIFLGLDLQPILVPAKKKLLQQMQFQGVRVQFLVYDILPLTHREYFSPGVYSHFFSWLETVSSFEKLICISRTTKDAVTMFLKVFFPDRLKSLKIESFVLANELPEKDVTRGTPIQADKIKSCFGKGNLFLMVGTIEPRKGHDEILSMMEHLWSDAVNSDLKLIFIGKRGWEVSELVNRIKRHKKNGKQLFWLENCSDEFLIELYSGSAGLIAASRAEGYSLPLVESQNFKLPVFARDIPIYREIGESYPGINYFFGKNPQQIADEFSLWRRTINQKIVLKKDTSMKICWKKATKDLEKIINE